MDDNQRKHIIKNIDRLIYLTDFDKLYQACLATEMLSNVMVQNIHRIEAPNTEEPWNEDTIKRERHKKLFEKITKRGPHAYVTLRHIFADLQYHDALALLVDDDDKHMISLAESKSTGIPTATPNTYEKKYVPSNNNNNEEVNRGVGPNRESQRLNSIDDDKTLHEYKGDICPKAKVTVKKSSRINKHPSIETYPMESKDNRGVFFMVNIIDFPNKEDHRAGSYEDAHSLMHLFKELGFKLFSYTNITQTDFWNILEELLNSEYTKHTECFVMALMTHGNMEYGVQRITFSDGSVVNVKDIEQRFYHHICTNLIHKPKIFLFPFCRGDIREKGVTVDKIQTDGSRYTEPRINNIGQLSDVCICYATAEDYRAHRDIEDGSWYIQYFVKNMAELAHDTAFEDIIKKIQADTLKLRTQQGHLQTANYVNKGFNKILYFNPGFPTE